MHFTAVTRPVVHTMQLVLCQLRVGGVLLVFPGLLPRFGEPSAILFAEITCPQPARTIVAAPNPQVKVLPPPTHSARLAAPVRVRVKPRSFFSLRLREMWEGYAQKS